jgi:hypothetical protein
MAVQLNKAFIDAISTGVQSTWAELAGDAYALAEECNEKMTNKGALELVLDADRMTTFGYKEADDLIGQAIKEHGYDKVMKHIAKNFKLVR